MTYRRLMVRSLLYHWRTNLAVLAGCVIATSVLAGALLVGDSMRGSLREMTLERLGAIDLALVGTRFFEQDLPARLARRPEFSEHFSQAAGVILIRGSVTGPGQSVAREVAIVGTTPEFWRLFPEVGDPQQLARQFIVNAELADALNAKVGARLVAQVEKASPIPREGLLGNRNEVLWRLPVQVNAILPTQGVGRFSLDTTQRLPKTLFVPIDRLARMIDQRGRANALFLVAKNPMSPDSEAAAKALLASTARLADYGLEIRESEKFQYLSLESRRLILEPIVAEVAVDVGKSMNAETLPVLTYLANRIAVKDREIPYSVVSAFDTAAAPPLGPLPTEPVARRLGPAEILLNQWAVEQLQAKPGDEVTLDYYTVSADGSLETKSHPFRLAGTVKMEGTAVDKDFAPEYPGISDADNFSDWDPPFPVDLKKVRKVDEDYWDDYRTTPKAFVDLEEAQKLWTTRHGRVTSVRFASPDIHALPELSRKLGDALLARISPEQLGFVFQAVKRLDLAASSGSTDFGGLFIAFSFFLIVSAALMIGLLFRLGVEQRASQIGVLLAVGIPVPAARRLLLVEGLMLAGVGSAVGIGGAVLFAKLMLAALTTWWRAAVNTPFVHFYWTPTSLAIGWVAGVMLSMLAILWGVGRLARVRIPRLLLPGFTFASLSVGGGGKFSKGLAVVAMACGVGLAIAPRLLGLDPVMSFFGAASLLLVGALAALSAWLREPGEEAVLGSRGYAVAKLGMRNAGRYPARSVLTAGLIASATFVVVAVGSMRHGDADSLPTLNSGNGGFSMVGQSDVPLFRNLNDPEARYDLNFSSGTEKLLRGSEIFAFRERQGDDASCLNIYQPRDPTLLAIPPSFVERGGFAFAKTLAANEAERKNPWLLLGKKFEDGAIPAIGDANTLQWILKVPLGGDLEITNESGHTIKLRMVAALSGSIFQGELLVSEEHFVREFPSIAGDRFFLVHSPPGEAHQLQSALEKDLAGYGFDVTTTQERIAMFKAVENTYMATFQTLGGLGLLLGTLGLATVILRNVLERRGELALLRALGLRQRTIVWLVVSETLFLLLAGIVVGAGCAFLAVLPMLMELSDLSSLVPLLELLGLLLLAGTASGLLAAWSALRADLIRSLRAE
ncbi:MAG: ABC transporter permease [Planctomycetota bacterium]